jgi:hypothetical protein
MRRSDQEGIMARDELMELMARVRSSIASLTARASDDRALTRAMAHLWSAHDELELLSRDLAGKRAS